MSELTIIADCVLAEAAYTRAKAWLHEQLQAGGLVADVEPCRVTMRGERELSCWCGNARLAAERSIVVYWRADRAVVNCQSYGGHKRYGTADGSTVVEAVRALLAQPKRGGVPAAFIAPETQTQQPGEDWSTYRCTNPRRSWGACAFCGQDVGQTTPRTFAVHAPDGRVAHYDCAPGLGGRVSDV
jgi:hypothetical protein